LKRVSERGVQPSGISLLPKEGFKEIDNFYRPKAGNPRIPF